MKIGYVPYSKNLTHPADRRRLGFWASQTRNKLEIENPLKSEIIVLSNAANFFFWLRKAKQPVVLDLVDTYFGTSPKFLEDFGRNLIRTLTGASSLRFLRYSSHVKWAIRTANLVVVASDEQANLVRIVGGKPMVIRDSHSEVVLENNLEHKTFQQVKIMWEGFGYTFKHFNSLASILDLSLFENDWELIIVSTPYFPKWGGKIGKVDLAREIRNMFPLSYKRITIVPWTLQNLREVAARCTFGIIPIDKKDSFAANKSENKLLSMWSLGLPTYTTNTNSYQRVLNEAGLDYYAVDNNWREILTKENLLADLSQNPYFHIKNYLDSHHNAEIIIAKWSDVLRMALNEN